MFVLRWQPRFTIKLKIFKKTSFFWLEKVRPDNFSIVSYKYVMHKSLVQRNGWKLWGLNYTSWLDESDGSSIYLGKQMSRPPLVSALLPCWSWNMFPQALPTAAILAITGRLWITNPTWNNMQLEFRLFAKDQKKIIKFVFFMWLWQIDYDVLKIKYHKPH